MQRVVTLAGFHSKGAVALEFLMLFPFVVAMLYAAAAYGIVFFSQYQLQSVADRAVSAALYVDRSAHPANELPGEVKGRADKAVTELFKGQAEALKTASANCEVVDLSDEVEGASRLELLRCTLTYNYKANPIVPAMSFGMLGTFPPMPDELKAEASAAF
ncbi:MAG: hypothetical protein CL543_07740 [Alcanivorax sp.]|nr:hypothetical protein [Alcanivorax sp.]